MEKLIHRQNITLEYLPNEGLSTDSPYKSSDDMDFNDVFGGPPRRFSMQEVRVRCSFSPEEIEYEDERLLSPWNGEKPVFGEESNGGSAVRRRQHNQSNEFYGDIFRGDDSSYSSPRRIDRDRDNVFGSSPSKPSPSSRHEAFTVSLPAQFSLPAKLNSLSRFSNQGNRNSPLSQQSSLGSSATEDLPSSNDHRCVGAEKESRNIVDGNNSENQFHFSIYKWAGTDVPMLIPLLSGKSRKGCNKVDSFAESGFSSEAKRDVSTSEEKINAAEMPGEELPVEAVEKVSEVKTLDDADIETNDIVKGEEASESLKSRVKSFRVFLTDDVENPGKVTKVKENKMERASEGYVKKAKKNETDPKSDEKTVLLQGDKKSGVKGKIRDFVQKFNQEADSSIKSDDVQKGSRSYRWKPASVQQRKNKPDVNIPKAEEKISSENQEKDQKNVTFKVEDKDEAKQYTDTKTPSYRTSHSFSNRRNEFSSGPRRRDSKNSMENLDDPLECNFLVQELSDDRQTNAQNDGSSEDIKALDAKIRQWSAGKKGNIRSLLSTLQYVLWQGSGWQPIALVDLIESNSVKRAYQKALLRVHPDKLQQKGAANDHKYIAEKVLDILQEAWDHFNTLGL